ncbi:RNA polymerase sigma factor [Phenylobacterium aquaticum]|uniref:RNA polymerase sigma factor n=1 Tax=Phenylobacterium aquaticum TaxID=1763816 RepID=UPI0026EB1B58|nr:RNA polymerase sigma factor [Phenylobacterium aquaticum]
MDMAVLDENLVEAARGGSAEAFSSLVARHQQALRAFLRRACRDWALADDLAQETFITAWSRIGRLQPGANVRAWLCGIGYNKALTAFRADRRARRRDDDYHKAVSISVSPVPEDRMALERAMADLPLEQRACVALCLAADFSHAEAAVALELPLGTVKSHVARGRARLLAALNIEDEEPANASS